MDTRGDKPAFAPPRRRVDKGFLWSMVGWAVRGESTECRFRGAANGLRGDGHDLSWPLWDETGRDGTEWNGMEWNGMERKWMGRDGMGWNGTGHD